jgi:hypothetical protein
MVVACLQLNLGVRWMHKSMVKTPILTKDRVLYLILFLVSTLCLWVAVESFLRREWIRGALFLLIIGGVLFDLRSRRREKAGRGDSTT